LAMVTEKEFDLIFMDMQMPVMDGLQATVKIRELAIATPIIALTANAYNSDKQLCLDAGMNDYATKPLKREALYQLVHQYYTSGERIKISRILLVDAEDNYLRSLEKELHSNFAHLNLHSAKSGVETCTMIGSFQPHIIILDLILPDMNGLAVMEYLAKSDTYKNIEVIILTSSKVSEDLSQQAASFKHCRVITQKDDFQELVKALNSVI
ncbi:MAG: response regulator, partial [Lentisphaeraceae bacterium]|nr:response regulator [Lentisphaeraceae bacterium]